MRTLRIITPAPIAGQNLPDKGYRYLRTVAVAPDSLGLRSSAREASRQHASGQGVAHLYIHFIVSRELCVLVNGCMGSLAAAPHTIWLGFGHV